MIIGEKMSGVVTDLESVIEGCDGQLYENFYTHRMGRPLHSAPSLYVRLRRLCADFAQVEVYEDHARSIITTVIQREDFVYTTQIEMETVVTRRRSMKLLAEEYFKDFNEQEARCTST